MAFDYKKYKEAQFKSPLEESKAKKVWNIAKKGVSKVGKYAVGGPWGALGWGFFDLLTTDLYGGKGRPLTDKEKFDKELHRSRTSYGQSKL